MYIERFWSVYSESCCPGYTQFVKSISFVHHLLNNKIGVALLSNLFPLYTTN